MVARRGIVRSSRLLVLLLVGALAAGCATAPDPKDSAALAEYQQINDPVEPTNRAIFSFNRFLDSALLKPVATAYRDYTPEFFQRSIHNILNNLRTPVILFNDVLQGEFKRAGVTLGRFLINSTIGVAGIGDPATDFGLPFHNEDFGQTLAVWGADEGPYIMLPILGPSNPRDTIGLIVDILIDPLNWWASNTDRNWIPFARSGVRAVDSRSRNIDALDDLEKSSLDFYAAIRSLYRQRRADEITNGEGSANMPAPGLGEMDGPSFGGEVSEAK